MEGYRNGFTEAKAAQIPNPSWLPSEDEIAEAEREMLELDESLQAGKEMNNYPCLACEDPSCKGCPLTEAELKAIQENQKAYQQMARDESGFIQFQKF